MWALIGIGRSYWWRRCNRRGGGLRIEKILQYYTLDLNK